ncbi:putative quinol monooxygenase [Rugosimonospora acidiphila]|uniref:putative quinol monooxygenase n=1 Tax=Rugosimonospora acidiphila TaxID=556531 RepID=UPI0031EFA467
MSGVAAQGAGCRVGRLMTMRARPGRGGELAGVLVEVAGGLRGFPGCEVYLISQDRADADVVYVVEVWSDEAAVAAALSAAGASPEGKARMTEVLAMVDGAPSRVDFVPLGGVGLA